MWKPLSIVSGVALLAGGGIIFAMVRPVLIAERTQVAKAGEYKLSTEKRKVEMDAAAKTADKELEKMKDGLSKA